MSKAQDKFKQKMEKLRNIDAAETQYVNAAIGNLEYEETQLMAPPPRKPRKQAVYKDPEGIVAAREALANFDEIVGRREMASALRYKGDPESIALAEELEDNENDAIRLFTLCRNARMRAADLITAYRDHQLAAGLTNIARRAPKILDDVAADAESIRVPCPGCDQTGEIITPDGMSIPCNACYGHGYIVKSGDKDARDLIWDALGMKKGGQNININMQQNNITPNDAVAPMSSFVIDVEAIDE